MTGNTLGYHLGNLTKQMKEMNRNFEELQRENKRKEILNSRLIWKFTLDYLKEIDKDFDKWYDDEIPDMIYWTGENFQNVLQILWARIYKVKYNL